MSYTQINQKFILYVVRANVKQVIENSKHLLKDLKQLQDIHVFWIEQVLNDKTVLCLQQDIKIVCCRLLLSELISKPFCL